MSIWIVEDSMHYCCLRSSYLKQLGVSFLLNDLFGFYVRVYKSYLICFLTCLILNICKYLILLSERRWLIKRQGRANGVNLCQRIGKNSFAVCGLQHKKNVGGIL